MVVGYTTGVFDMFHIGHLNILERSKEQCDFLIVGVSTDELVMEYKNTNPVIEFKDRLRIIKALRCVDKVVAQENMNKMLAWEKYRFQKMFVGSDWKGTEKWAKYESEFLQIGVEVVYLEYTKEISSTKLRTFINDYYKTR